SSRRRHTICYRDSSSDVCSSDLLLLTGRLPSSDRNRAKPASRISISPLTLQRQSTPKFFSPSLGLCWPWPHSRRTPLNGHVAREIGRASCRESVAAVAVADGRTS